MSTSRRRRAPKTAGRFLVSLMAVTMVTLGLGVPPAFADAAGRPFTPTPMAAVPGHDVKPSAPAVNDPTAAMDVTSAPKVTWPAATTAQVDLGGVVAGTMRTMAGTPVRIGRSATTSARTTATTTATAGTVGIQMYDHAAALRAHVDGTVFRLTAAGSAGAAPAATSAPRSSAAGTSALVGPVPGAVSVSVSVDYSGFARAYGGDWAGRLHLVRLPECALTTPEAAGCAATSVPSTNDRAHRTVSATVAMSAVAMPAGASANRVGSGGVVLALTAGDSSDNGDFKATSLSPSATWSAGGSSGDYSWSYPMRMPPSLGGPAPEVALGYSAQGVDGQTAAANSQPSWIGEGFDYSPGYIERSYNACSDDGQSSTIGDECWAGDNATLSMSGRGGELVRDDTTGTWHSSNDDGSRIQKITTTNGDNDGEAWLLTTQDGTRYYFGLDTLPGAPAGSDTKATWTTPVFGDDAGEPCHASTFAASYCSQAYRWNLDYVVDPLGNTMSLWYDTETNNYARNHTDTAVSNYVRAGTINHIEYGTRQDPTTGADSRFITPAPMRVDFAVVDRCITPGATCTSATPSNWPDVPWDQACTSTTNCSGHYSATMWSTKRLSTVTTRVWGSGSYRDVEQWTLNTEFKDPGDGNQQILWLKSLSHSGLTPGYPAASTTPDITFGAVAMSNRVDVNSSTNPIWRFRMASITSESGGVTSITYSPADCQIGGAMPSAPESNNRRCFPVYWLKPGASAPSLEYFQRYVVTSVTESDPVGGGLPVTTYYTYLDAPAWHYDDNAFIPVARRTYGQWRGYTQVRTVVGQAGTIQSQTDSLYFRGMNGDKLPTGVRSASVVDSLGTSTPDDPWLAGAEREQINYSGVSAAGAAYGTGAPYVAKTLNTQWVYGPTATQNLGGVNLSAYVSNIGSVTTYTALATGPDRVTRTTNTYDGPTGRVLSVDDAGDISTTADDRCRRNEYAENSAKGMFAYVARIETVSVSCSSPVSRPAQVLSDVRSYFDGATTFDKQLTLGQVTRIEQMVSYSNGQPVYAVVSRTAYDAYGRVRDTFDALNHETTTAYTPATGGPLTTVTVTNPMGWQSSTVLEPAWGSTTHIVDANGHVTDVQYDSLGRVVAVWGPGRDKATQSASDTYTYQIRNNAVSTIASTTLNTAGTGYLTSYALYDGQLRLRQSQTPSATGTGRVIQDTIYDYRGMTWKVNNSYYTSGTPGPTLFAVADASVPSQQITLYDNAGRLTDSILDSYNVEKSRTKNSYGGDRVNTTPPAGGIATTSVTDGRNQLIELRQYQASTPTGAYSSTKYAYTPAGSISTVTDAAGSVWRYTYDQLGRRTTTVDPDAGTINVAYDADGEQISSTDARGITVVTAYDQLGRKVSTWRDAVTTGVELTAYQYDTIARGQLTSATRWENGQAYTSRVTGYDANYRPTGNSITIPASDSAVAGTYTTGATFNADGTPATTTLPAIGGLPAETLTYGYNSVGLPSTMSGASTYLVSSAYDPLGRPTEAILSDGTKSLAKDFVYDVPTGRMVRHLVWGDTTPQVLSDDNYSYDPAGNVTAIADKLAQYGAGSDDDQCFRYDNLQRLTSAWTPANGNCTTAPTTAALGGPAPYWLDYTYDAASDRRSEVNHTTAGDSTHTYTYPAATATQPHALGSVTGPDGTASFTYDAAGDTTTRALPTGTQTLGWDAEGHLHTVTQGGATTSYLYDADGVQLIRRDTSGTTLYLNGQELHAGPSGTLTATRYYGEHAVRTTAGGLSWLASDHQGTADISVHAGDMTATLRRETPFGGTRGTVPPAWPSEKGFVGGTKDTLTGLVSLGAREYDPVTGRFVSVDPINDPTDPQQLQGYAYAGDSPVTDSDPTGAYRQPIDGGGGGGSAGSSGSSSSGAAPGPAKDTTDKHPKGLRPGMGPHSNVYEAEMYDAKGHAVMVYVAVTDACDYSSGVEACGGDNNRLFNVEVLGKEVACTGDPNAAAPCYLGNDGDIHDISGQRVSCTNFGLFSTACPVGVLADKPNPVMQVSVNLSPDHIYTQRCPNKEDQNLGPSTGIGYVPPPEDNDTCQKADTQCHVSKALEIIDDWFGWQPEVGAITAAAGAAQDVSNGDYAGAAGEVFKMMTDHLFADGVEDAAGDAASGLVTRVTQRELDGKIASMGTKTIVNGGASMICAHTPSDMGLIGFCMF